MRHLLIAAMVAIAFGMAAAPVQADDVASATATGACYDADYDEGDNDPNDDAHGAEDSASVTVTDGPDASASQPSQENVEEGLGACANSAQDGEAPDGGSHATVTVDAGGETVEVSTDDVTSELP